MLVYRLWHRDHVDEKTLLCFIDWRDIEEVREGHTSIIMHHSLSTKRASKRELLFLSVIKNQDTKWTVGPLVPYTNLLCLLQKNTCPLNNSFKRRVPWHKKILFTYCPSFFFYSWRIYWDFFFNITVMNIETKGQRPFLPCELHSSEFIMMTWASVSSASVCQWAWFPSSAKNIPAS